MAYPFPGVSFGDFMKRVQTDFGVTEHRSATVIHGPRGPVPVVWLQREVDGITLRVSKPDLDDDQTVAPLLMDNLCRRLDLDKKAFGYHLT